jgi:hypothetical protein
MRLLIILPHSITERIMNGKGLGQGLENGICSINILFLPLLWIAKTSRPVRVLTGKRMAFQGFR